jgi:hypothetical protein
LAVLVRLGVQPVVEDDPDRKPVPPHPIVGMGYIARSSMPAVSQPGRRSSERGANLDLAAAGRRKLGPTVLP